MLSIYLSALETDAEKDIFAEIYEDTKEVCFSAAMRITRDKFLAEDAVHDAFFEVIKRKEYFFAADCDKRRSLIVIIVKNKAKDIMRKEKTRESAHLDEICESNLDGGLDFLDDIVSRESEEFLLSCVAKLSNTYKTLFELRFVHEMSYREIANFLDISETNVSTRLQRAKFALKKIVKEEGNGYEY